MGNSHILLESGGVYHLYNHAVGSDNLFREEENYLFFMRKFESRILPVVEIFAYCLMPNHFHFVIRVRDKYEIFSHYQEKVDAVRASMIKRNRDAADHDLIDALLIGEFGTLFNSYAQAYNRRYRRMGSLFKESFQRKRPDTDIGILRLICYVHNNPVNHGYVHKREDWKYSSFNSILSEKKTIVPRNEVLSLFGGRENFIFLHNKFISDEV
jgi:putative transposase